MSAHCKIFKYTAGLLCMDIEQLVDKYIDQIKIEDTDYTPVEYSESDAACILLNIPIAMLHEYALLKGPNKELPDGAEFWKETKLVNRLKKSEYRGHAPLEDVLFWLGGNVLRSYQELNIRGRIRLDITEGPKQKTLSQYS